MNILDINGPFYRWLEKFTNYFLLNLLWILSCLPIVTIFPATAAMFGVVRKWEQKEEVGIFKSFYSLFKENFLRSFLFGIVWFSLSFLFYFNISVSLQMSGILKFIMVPILAFFCLLFIMTSVFLFPVMVHYKMRWLSLIKNAFLFSVTQIKVTILCGLVLLVSAVMSYILPISFFIIWSIAAYNVYKLCNQSFYKMEVLGQSISQSNSTVEI